MIQLDLTKKYALAVSGGIDSMVMLHLFANACPRPNFFVATVDHGIRAEAASDCDFVAKRCAELGVECQIFRVDVPAYAAEQKLSLETAARILRYRVLDALPCDVVCLAHNADDNAETVLMHILRGSGAKGATGIKPQSGKYLRPLLQWTRADIQRYAQENDVVHVTDNTNDDTRYTRNFIRHKVMPVLQTLNPRAKQNLLRFACNVAQDDEYLDALADVSQVTFDEQSARIPRYLLSQPLPIAYRVLFKVFNRLGVYRDVEKTHFDALVSLAANTGGKKLDLPFDFEAYNDYDAVTICKKRDAARYCFEIPFALGCTQTPLGVLEVTDKFLPDSLRIDVDKVPANSVLRTRKKGDFFVKFGGGKKPLNRYLIDKKISERNRDSLLLIASDSEVLAVVGVEISDKLRVEGDAKSYYICLRTY